MAWLRAKLSAAGLDTTGLKAALQHRYEAHLKQQETLAMVPLNSKDLVLLVGAVIRYGSPTHDMLWQSAPSDPDWRV